MKNRVWKFMMALAVVALACGCFNRDKKGEAKFTAGRISVETLSPGDTTSILGKGFGKEKGEVFIGENSAQIISWHDKVIRIKTPSVPEERYSVEVQPAGCKKKYAGKIAVRSSMDDGLYAWLDEDISEIDGSEMEPLIMVFKPVGPLVTGLFDYDAPIPKNRDEYLDEIEWACLQGVQVVQLYFPGAYAGSAENYADTSMDNIRYITGEVARRCPGVIIELDYTDTNMPVGNRELARQLPLATIESIYNIGGFQKPAGSKLDLAPLTDVGGVNLAIANSIGHYKHPVPVVMTTWQAYDIQNLSLQNAALPEPFTFILRMALDKRAVDDKKTYKNIIKLLPEGSRAIAATTLEHVSEILGYSITQGDHIAFGFNYSQYWPGGTEYYIQNNLFMLEKIRQTAEMIGRPIATTGQARKMMGATAGPSAEKAKIKVGNKISDKPRRRYVGRGRNRRAVLDGLPANNIFSIATTIDKQEIWISTDAGTFFSDDGAATFQQVKFKTGKPGVPPAAIATTANGGVWIATPGAGILKTADHGKSFNRYTVESKSLNGDKVACLYAYGNEIYSCTFDAESGAGTGITYTTDSGATWEIWTSDYGLPFDDVRTVLVEDEWVFAGFGPYTVNSDAAGLGISPDFGESWSLVEGIDKPVLAISVWHDNTLIVGTKGGGAFTVFYDGTRLQRLDAAPASATVTDITIDPRGWVWLATDSGILVSDNLKTFRTFTTGDGVGSTAITGGVYAPPNAMLFSTRAAGDHTGGLTRIVVSP